MSEFDFTAENVEKALHQLYYDPSISSKDVAQKWLTKAQRAPQAWQFAWELLQEEKATEVQYFGASALISKISSSWDDIPESDVVVLRDRLFQQLLVFCKLAGKQIALTRLCVAFSAFFVKCAIKNLWPNAITDIIDKLEDADIGNVTKEQRNCALLEILIILPEEYQTTSMTKQKKVLIFSALHAGQSRVLKLLPTLLYEASSKVVQARVIKCLSSWILLGIPLDVCEQLLGNVFECLSQPDLFDAAVECLLNAFCSPGSCDYPNTIKRFMPHILSLRSMLQKSIDNEDADSISGLTKVICGYAENHPGLLLDSFQDMQGGLGIVSLILQCGGIPLQYPTDEYSSVTSFTFWCSFQDEIEATSGERGTQIRQHLYPFFYELINCLLRKACYPKDNSHESWSADEKEQHRIYRIDISDTLMYLLNMLGCDVLVYIFNQLEFCLQEFNSNSEKPWHGVEVCLFGIHSVVEVLIEGATEIPCLKSLTHMLSSITVNSVQLAETMLYTIGTLTDFLSFYPENLWQLFSFSMSCLSNHELALSAILTIRRLTRECNEPLALHSITIMQQMSNILNSGVLRNNEETWLMQSAGFVLSSMPTEACIKHLENLLHVHMNQLEALSKDPVTVPTKNSIIHILDLLSNLLLTLNDENEETGDRTPPAILILQKLQPIFVNILNVWVSDVEVVIALCNLYEKSIRSLVNEFSPVLSHLCDMLSKLFQSFPYPCVLDLTQQLVLVFGTSTGPFQDIVTALLRILINTSLIIYNKELYKINPDFGHSFMRLLSVICRKADVLFSLQVKYNDQVLMDIFKCGILTVQLLDSESANSGSAFLNDFISLYSKSSNFAAVVNNTGKEVIMVSLKAVGGAASRNSIEHYADIMFNLSHCNFPMYCSWLKELLELPDVPCTSVDKMKKSVFVKQVLREIKNKRKYRDLLKDFTLICRGLDGTEYAANAT